jgi:hypothetical protein
VAISYDRSPFAPWNLAGVDPVWLDHALSTLPESWLPRAADRFGAFRKTHEKRQVIEEMTDEIEHVQRHPLYSTHHQRRVISQWWKVKDEPMPQKALDGFTHWIQINALADEDTVRQLAAELLDTCIKPINRHNKYVQLRSRLGRFADTITADSDVPTERLLRRKLRLAFRQYNEQAAHILQIVGKKGEKYVSDITRNGRAWQLKKQQDWIDASHVESEDKSIPLGECVRTPEARYAELYTLMKGQEDYFTSRGYVALFTTLTLPPAFHPNPSSTTESKWDGSTPADGHPWLTHRWQKLRADLKKYDIVMDGFRVTEPHKDGCEHWHVMSYVKQADLKLVQSKFLRYFGHSDHAVKFKADFTKDVKNKKATAASYMLKYLVKTIGSGASKNTSAANDERFNSDADAADAWRSTWGIRGFQFFGVLFGKQTLWRELRRSEKQPAEHAAKKLWRAARGGRASTFIAAIVDDAPEIATLREVKEVWTDPDTNGEIEKIGEVKGRILGVQINKIRYITHTTKWAIKTDFEALNEDLSSTVTVIHKDPRDAHDDTPNRAYTVSKEAEPPPKARRYA